ncbi:MAG TPA: class I SAM-dependent methyltransferase [Burkholderiaceae bacterium]|nr:class I SAM-dependent methyltransferase [Burkholderiaceae bacterium]
MLTLPTVSKESINAAMIDWAGLSKRYINPGELECVIGLLQEVKPKAMIEFGVNEGRTAFAVLRSVPSITHYLGIDVPRGFTPPLRVQRNEVPVQPGHLVENDPRFTLLLPTMGSRYLTPGDLFEVDAVFVDGDHSYDGVMHDTMLAWSVIRPGGVIIWHDYHDAGTVEVREALHDLAEHGEEIMHIEGTWLAFQRINGSLA